VAQVSDKPAAASLPSGMAAGTVSYRARSRWGPMVRIHFPPAASQQQTVPGVGRRWSQKDESRRVYASPGYKFIATTRPLGQQSIVPKRVSRCAREPLRASAARMPRSPPPRTS
jgi:hypothetical protein